jgi:hypothetical protein
MKEIFLKQIELGKFIDLSPRRIRDLEKRGIFKRRNGKYPLAESIRSYIGFLRNQVEGDEMRAAKLRREISKAEHQEIVTEQLKGSLIDREQAVVWLSAICIEAQNAFWTFPRRFSAHLAAMTDEREIESLLQEEIRNILNALVEALKKEYHSVDELSRQFFVAFRDFNKSANRSKNESERPHQKGGR